MRAEHDVDPGRPICDRRPVFLRQAATDSDLHAGVAVLNEQQMTEVSIQPVVGVLPNRAGVENNHVGLLSASRLEVASSLQATRPAAQSRACSSGTRRCESQRSAERPRQTCSLG